METKSLSPFKTLHVLGGIAAIGLASLNFAPHAMAAGGSEEPGKVEGVEAREDLDLILRATDSMRGKMRLLEISQRLKLSESDVVGFFKEEVKSGRLDKKTSAAWSVLLGGLSVSKAGATASDFQNADVLAEAVGSFISIRKSGLADNLKLNESELADMQKSWTVAQRGNFARVLRRTAELSKGNQFVTTEDAFQKALDELGYLEKYKKGCNL